MQEELTPLEENHTWDLLPLTSDMNIIGTKWVCKVKYRADNSVEKLKARLLVKGYNQQE